MPEVQKSIYYLTGVSFASTRNSLFLEVLKKKGFSKEGLELEGTDEETTLKDEAKQFEDFCKVIKDMLVDKVTRLRRSSSPTASPTLHMYSSLGSPVGYRTWNVS